MEGRTRTPSPPPPPPPTAEPEIKVKRMNLETTRLKIPNNFSEERKTKTKNGIKNACPTSSENKEDLVQQLGEKVQRQARELTVLQLDLVQKDEYSQLCEKWIVAVEPDVIFPISEEAVSKVQKLYQNQHYKLSSNSQLNELKSAVEKQRQNSLNKQAMHTLQKKYEAEAEKSTQHLRRIRELKTYASEQERAKVLAQKKCARLNRQLVDLQAKLNKNKRPVQLQTNATYGSNGIIDDCALSPTKKSSKTFFSANTDENNRMIFGDEVGELREEIKMLNRRLEKEMKAGEDQRVYIDVLQTTLKGQHDNEETIDVKDKISAKMVAELESLRYEIANQKRKIAEISQDKLDLQELLETKDDELKMLQKDVEKFEKGDKDKMFQRMKTLEQENDTLLDYVQDVVEPLKKHNRELVNKEIELKEKIKSLIQETTESKDEHEKLKHVVEEHKLESLQKEIDVKSLREKLDSLGIQYEGKLREVEEVKALNVSIKKQLSSKDEEVVALTTELHKIRADCENSVEKAKELEEVKVSLTCSRRDLVTFEEQNTILKNEIQALEHVQKDLISKINGQKVKMESLNTMLNQATMSRNELEQIENDQRIRILDLETSLQLHEKELKELQGLKAATDLVETRLANAWAQHKDTSVVSVINALYEDSIGDMTPLHHVLPNIDLLIKATKAESHRIQVEERTIKDRVESTGKMYEVEKRLLHDEIHSLRSQLDKTIPMQKKNNSLILELEKLKKEFDFERAQEKKLADMMEKYTRLEFEYNELKQRTGFDHFASIEKLNGDRFPRADTNNKVLSEFSGVANEEVHQIEILREELSRAAKLAEQQNEMVNSLESTVECLNTDLKKVCNERDTIVTICQTSLQNILLRYERRHQAVKDFKNTMFSNGRVEAISHSIHQRAQIESTESKEEKSRREYPELVCSLLEAILVYDTSPSLVGFMNKSEMDSCNVNDCISNRQRGIRQKEVIYRNSMSARDLRLKELQASRSHRSKHKGCYKIDNNNLYNEYDENHGEIYLNSLRRRQRTYESPQDDSDVDVAESDEENTYIIEDDDDDVSYRGPKTRPKHNLPRRTPTRRNRTESPRKVRVHKDGSVEVMTYTSRNGSDTDDLELAARLQRIDRVRKGSFASNSQFTNSIAAQKYRQRLKHAKEAFKKLQSKRVYF